MSSTSSALSGVEEDVAEIILNIKGIVLSSEYDEPVVMYLRKAARARRPAGDITPPAGVTIDNPDLHLATLDEDGELEIEFDGRTRPRLCPPPLNKQAHAEICRIPVDSVYCRSSR